MALVDERAARVANELEVEQLDLMPLLERSLVNYYDGFHATPAGARTVAAAVAAAVLQRSRPSARTLDRTGRIDAADTYPSRRTASGDDRPIPAEFLQNEFLPDAREGASPSTGRGGIDGQRR